MPEKNTIESYTATLSKFRDHIGTDRHLDKISSEEILSFLNKITEGGKQQTKHGRYSHLRAFFNFIKTNFDSTLQNPCDTPMLRKLYRPGKPNHWSIVEKETIDEIISGQQSMKPPAPGTYGQRRDEGRRGAEAHPENVIEQSLKGPPAQDWAQFTFLVRK